MTTAASAWQWFPAEFDPLVCATFARGVTPDQVIEAFGANPADARLLTAEDAREEGASVRVGRAGEWAFALDDGCADPWERERISTALSAATEVVTYEINPELSHFRYYANGDEVTSFEPLLAHDRAGTEPDRFLPLMRQAGLRADDADDDDGDPDIALLVMLTLAFGIRLSLEETAGPLLTVRPPLNGPGL